MAKSQSAGRSEAAALWPDPACEVCGIRPADRHHVDGDETHNTSDNVRFYCRKHHAEIGHAGRWGFASPKSQRRGGTFTDAQREHIRSAMTGERGREMALRGMELNPMTSERAREMARRPRSPWSPARRAAWEAKRKD